MTLTSSMEFIHTALFESKELELSYTDPDQKWIIRNHFLKLLEDFPSFIPSTNTYTHFDGKTTNLLNINGFLHVSEFLPEIPIIIWVHENYPVMSPMIFIPSNLDCRIHKDHLFIDQSGVVTPPYLLNWDHSRSNLCELLHNLITLFRHDHPSMPSSVLKETILNDLYAKISHDLAVRDEQIGDEIERLSNEQIELQKRSYDLDEKICREENERDFLEKRVMEIKEYNEKLFDWLRKYEKMSPTMENVANQIFGKKKKIIDCLIEDDALDDVICALDKGLDEGFVSLDVYIREVRRLARDQFYQRAMRLKLKTLKS
ncbi:protein ELC-like [Amaranthus tricolor]|uniref:protein ELC-like n=1 Tax=Amaranthus tricolor TaxID=29722 RepID=UPI0025902A82|nr:protein ELC-like [Amaranthus tricolor]